MKQNLMKKALVATIILLFCNITVVPSITTKMLITNEATNSAYSCTIQMDPGTLSGYVSDTSMNPIMGATIRVYFHGTFRENISNATGYYHVIDIPICNCTKNATCSKQGYNTAWVYLTILENTTYDFILESKDHWLYVGGSGPGNYSKIQDAIDNASDGDTVFVFDENSPYTGNITINKSIQVIGEDKNTTILLGIGLHDYEFSSIVITTDGVNLSGFTLQQQTGSYGIWIKGNETNITDCIIDDYWFGIYIYSGLIDIDSTKNIVYNNLIKNCFIGLDVYRSSNTVIAHNSINNCILDNRGGGGISIVHGDNTVISNNDIRLDGVGVWTEDSEDVSIFLNNVTKNAIGISTSSANNIKITQNNIYRNRVMNIVFDEYPHQNMEVNNNYWGMLGLHQKIVFGQLLIYLFTLHLDKLNPYIWTDWPLYLHLPKIYIDKNPAQEPYDIPGMI